MQLANLTSTSQTPNAAPAGAASVPAETAEHAPPPPDQDAARVAAEEDQALTIQQHTLRYRVDGKQINVEILDNDGRVVRTIPPQDLMKLRNQQLTPSTLSIRG